MGEDQMNRLFRMRQTVMEMLGDRGYLVGDFDRRMSKMDFIQKFRESIRREDLTINKSKKNDPFDQLYVFFPSDEKEAELLVNIKKHVLVPEHQCLQLRRRKPCWSGTLSKKLSRQSSARAVQQPPFILCGPPSP
ncbi:hypothetical protein KSP39_PZI019464 [Platanthera zijinensis]|uniref:RNA polymerase Rpb5 N-terminal domain-containing protein n=1 Tax=Platanthera zijinensis TaxID=2320716 RepID=A0AAP0B2R8_9ASPA